MSAEKKHYIVVQSKREQRLVPHRWLYRFGLFTSITEQRESEYQICAVDDKDAVAQALAYTKLNSAHLVAIYAHECQGAFLNCHGFLIWP